MRAIASCAPLIPISLLFQISLFCLPICFLEASTHHFGSGIGIPCSSACPSGMKTLQCTTKAHIEKADAIGPKVLAIKGNAVLNIHHELETPN